MGAVYMTSGQGYRVGDLLMISSPIYELRVAGVSSRRFQVEWPWGEADPNSEVGEWDGFYSFPRDPDDHDWRNTPWRIEPDGWSLSKGDAFLIAVPETEVRVVGIVNFDPPDDIGSLPRPTWALGLRPLEYDDDEEAGFTLYLNSDEPIDIVPVSSVDDGGSRSR